MSIFGGFQLREPEVYGDVQLSIQASGTHYCEPRVPGLPLDEYKKVEVAVLGPAETLKTAFGRITTRLCRSSVIGVEGFDHLFEEGSAPVAGYVSWDDVNRLRDALRKRQEAAQ